jgi:hypothetical protein
MTDFDCGKLCAPKNDGIPECCDPRTTFPILYRDEFKWHKSRSNFWKRMRPRNKEARDLAKQLDDYVTMCDCPGGADCSRQLRSLCCRLFPFEPFVDKDGNVLGLTYNYEMEDRCPLIGKSQRSFNPEYIRNSITFWREFLDLFPEERELYTDECRKLERRFKRKRQKLAIFK